MLSKQIPNQLSWRTAFPPMQCMWLTLEKSVEELAAGG